jgi:hypothetical protein
LIIVNITVIITVSTKPIALIDKVGINKAMAARIDIEALATAVKTLIKGTVKDRQFIKEKLLEDR